MKKVETIYKKQTIKSALNDYLNDIEASDIEVTELIAIGVSEGNAFFVPLVDIRHSLLLVGALSVVMNAMQLGDISTENTID